MPLNHSAIFLDRDGVIIENRDDYVRKWSEVRFLPGSLEALQVLSFTSHKVILVTNQSVVGRGLISLEQAESINVQLKAAVEREGGRIDGIYMCPHAPNQGCVCRKPAPGLIERAAGDHQIDLNHSVLIGDAITDLQAAWSAGVGRACLVETGRGRGQIEAGLNQNLPQFPVFSDLLEAIIWTAQIKGNKRLGDL